MKPCFDLPSRRRALAWIAFLAVAAMCARTFADVPKVAAASADACEMLSPSAIHVDGWLGARIDANERQRLLAVDTEPLLAGYHKKPGSHPWIGEHIGKWMHAATLAWAYSGDQRLRDKLDRAAAELIGCQEPDGYLGTYVPEQRFGQFPGADWDVWSHKYNLIGLMTYYEYTGDKAALEACRKMADLLIATFPAKKSILAAGTHMGMAATSVLEPIVLLYRATGDGRYLQFARYIVKSWDEPNGPKIAASLLKTKRVDKTANAKAYEMLSNLVGLCELFRATGDRELLQVVKNAWQDIVDNRLYITGSASSFECFHGDHELPNTVNENICETCVTTTWIQLNLQLLRLTGEAKYGDELERSLYNHLAAAQHPRGDDWCYYTALEGRKPYDKGITCCHSSGPRGMALAPQAAYLRGHSGGADVLLVSTFETSRATLEFGGQKVTMEQSSEFPQHGHSTITLQTVGPATFGIKVRVPSWAVPAAIEVAGARHKTDSAGWIVLPPQAWNSGDRIDVIFHLGPKLIVGDHGNAGRAALAWGPFVLAFDQANNPGLPPSKTLGLIDSQPLLTLEPESRLVFEGKVVAQKGDEPKTAIFVPFADAGSGGGAYRVWLRAPGASAKQTTSEAE
ncbi:MAG: glycoside hydrolase family 127 protein [Thermoguttaceae bacterium]